MKYRTMSRLNTRLLALGASGVAALGVALWVRYGLVEPQGMALLCAQASGASCRVRDTAIALFTQQRLGYLSLAAALLALLPRLRPLAWIGWLVGLAGLALYCFEPSAPALLLALLVLARPAPANSRQSASQA